MQLDSSFGLFSCGGVVRWRTHALVAYLAEHRVGFGADPSATLEAALATLDQCQPVVRFKLWELSPSQECYAKYAACVLLGAATPRPGAQPAWRTASRSSSTACTS